MRKKILLLIGIIIALVMCYRYTMLSTYDWIMVTALRSRHLYGIAATPSTEQITLLVCGIISLLLLVGSLVFLFKDFKADKYWERALFLAVARAITIILSSLIINGLILTNELGNPERSEKYKISIKAGYATTFILPVIIVALMTISYIFSRKEEKVKTA
ncbi:MAG: hypothetical protein J6T15_02420 [Bacilli bacterium]|nr:hypothetical protein [Bacilli bacterium]